MTFDYIQPSYNEPFSQALSQSVVETTWPWKPLEMVTFVDYDIGEDKYRIVVELMWSKPTTWVYWFRMPWLREMDEETTLRVLCNELRYHFRNWRDTEPEPNIILGDN